MTEKDIESKKKELLAEKAWLERQIVKDEKAKAKLERGPGPLGRLGEALKGRMQTKVKHALEKENEKKAQKRAQEKNAKIARLENFQGKILAEKDKREGAEMTRGVAAAARAADQEAARKEIEAGMREWDTPDKLRTIKSDADRAREYQTAAKEQGELWERFKKERKEREEKELEELREPLEPKFSEIDRAIAQSEIEAGQKEWDTPDKLREKKKGILRMLGEGFARGKNPEGDRRLKTDLASAAGAPTEPKKELVPKTQKEEGFEKARHEYFALKKEINEQGWTQQNIHAFEKAGETYKATKKKIIEGLLAKGELGKAEAREFLLGEVELQRKFDIENKLAGKGERMMAAVSKGIEKWDNFGKAEGIKGYAQRFLKTGISLAMIGAVSGLSVQKLADLGIGTASALGGGLTSYLGKRMAMGSAMAGIMALVPGDKKKWVSGVLVAGAAGAVVAGAGVMVGGIVASSAIGLGLAHLTKKYTKKIENRMEKIKEGQINLDTLDADIEKMEKEMAETLRKAQSTRIKGKLLEGATAIAGSMAALEIMGGIHNLQTHPETPAATQAHKESDVAPTSTPASTPTPTPAHPAPGTPQPEVTPHAAVTPAEPAQTAATTTPEAAPTAEVNPDAVVHQGQGVEHALIRQIENNPKLAQELGYTGDIDDKAALHAFAGKEAHVIALDTGYADNAGHEIRVAEADKVAYELKTENGQPVVTERTVDGTVTDMHHVGDKFETEREKYEYQYQKTPPMESPVMGASPNVAVENEIGRDAFRDVRFGENLQEHAITSNIPAEHHFRTEEAIRTQLGEQYKSIDTTKIAPEGGNILGDNPIPRPQPGGVIWKGESAEESNTGPLIVSHGITNGLVGNHFALGTESLKEVNNLYEHNLHTIFPAASGEFSLAPWITDFSHRDAHHLLENSMEANATDPNSPFDQMVHYMHKLKDLAPDIKPRNGFLGIGKEDAAHWIARALQSLAKNGKLDQAIYHIK